MGRFFCFCYPRCYPNRHLKEVYAAKLLIFGAPARVRTRDPLITNQVLYQLSYKGNGCEVADSDLL